MPPAKRQRFDSAPQQPRLQQSSSSQGIPLGPSKPSNLPQQPNQLQAQGSFSGNANRGGIGGGRGSGMNRGGRGGNPSGNRGMGMNRGRAASMHGGGGRGGGSNQSNGPLRGHPSRDRNNNFGNFNRRGGGSFNGPHHQNNSSFRSGHGGRSGNNQSHNRSNRGDGFHHNRASTNAASVSGSGSGKREENRRTLTDFKIIGLEIASLGWKWGQIPDGSGLVEETQKSEAPDAESLHSESVKDATVEHSESINASKDGTASSTSPARMRIYFHTPPSADDSRPIISTPSVSDMRKGKRKKLDDDDGDAGDEIRAPPPPPVPGGTETTDGSTTVTGDDQDGNTGRGSADPSVEGTASEADWLMAAIAEGDGDGEMDSEICEQTQVELDMDDHDQDGSFELDDNISETGTQKTELVGSQMDDTGIENYDEKEDSQVTPIPSLRNGDAADASRHKPIKASTSFSEDDATTSLSRKQEAKGSDLIDDKNEIEPELIVSQVERSASTKHEDEIASVRGEVVSTSKDFNSPGKSVVDVDHLPEPPASPTSNTAFSGTSTNSSTINHDLPPKPVTNSPKVPSANRVSIAYAAGSKRLLIDAEIVEKMFVFRAEGRIDIDMTIERVSDGFKGILIESLGENKAYTPILELTEALEADETLPPFWKLESGTRSLLRVYLDKERPLSEPKWVKTGDVQDWLRDMFGGRFWVAGDAVGWEKKIEVRYPDPAPTIQTVLAGWSTNSPVGNPSERARFVKTHMTNADNLLEILLRLVRGERATPFSQNGSAISTPSITGPLLAAMDSSSPHAAQQTHVSLAVIAIVRLASKLAVQSLGEEKGKEHVDERVGEIIRSLPSHLLYKSLDGIFKEWRSEKKGGR